MVALLPLMTAVILGGSLLFNLIAFWAPYWFVSPFSHGGLWQSCRKNMYWESIICLSNTSSKIGWLDATRAMMIFAMLCVAGATLVAVLFLVNENFRSKTYVNIIVMTAFESGEIDGPKETQHSALCALIAISVYGSKKKESTTLGWAYWMALIHMILGGVGGGLAAYQLTQTTT